MSKTWLLVLACSAFTSLAQAQVKWEVVNRFPVLSEGAFQRLLAEVGPDGSSIESRLTQVDFRTKVRHLDPKEPSAWSEAKNQYDVERLLSPKVVVVATTSLGTSECAWTLAGPRTETKNGPCNKVRFSVELGTSYSLQAVRLSDSQSQSTSVLARRRLIVAVGDSFTSGEGNPDYPAQVKKTFRNQPPHDWATDSKYPASALRVQSAQWLDTDCHRSLLAWPALYAMRQALSQPDVVVQFASFACSGAEVLDGFLLPQRNPPGRIGVELKNNISWLKRSQQEALAGLLCHGQPPIRRIVALGEGLEVYMERYGKSNVKVQLHSCVQPATPDEVLVQFGGNDTSFAGVVKYVFQPQPLKYRGGLFALFLESGVNFGLYKALAPVPPAEAAGFIANLPKLYALLDQGLKEIGIDGARVPVRLLMYPDPAKSARPASDPQAELASCNLRTRDANRPMQSLIAGGLSILKHESALSGANSTRLLEVQATYITALRDMQREAAPKQWKLEDSEPAFEGSGLCAGSLECEALGDKCPNGDRVRWGYWTNDDTCGKEKKEKCVFAPATSAWAQMSDFAAYDLERKRGMRYANDALLTSARLEGGRVRLDWAAGIAHPTAAVHARIAALLGDTSQKKGQGHGQATSQ